MRRRESGPVWKTGLALPLSAFFIFLLLTGNAFGQTSSVDGQVVDEEIGSALPYARVSIPETRKVTIADSMGIFRLEDLPPGVVSISVSNTGYATRLVKFDLLPGENHVEIRLKEQWVVIPEVVVTGERYQICDQSPSEIDVIRQEELNLGGSPTLTDALVRVPGITMLSTGPGISKPVIRGLFGNRIQIHLLNQRFDNQQWQDEHSLGLNDLGVGSVQVLKGPVSLIYGPEAMGGVIHILEEDPAPQDSSIADVSTRLYSNSLGMSVQGGYRKSWGNAGIRIRLGHDSHADYMDGNGMRILNSRFSNTTGKLSFTCHSNRWLCRNDYLFSNAGQGFIMEASQLNLPADDRWSRSLTMPHHIVQLHILSSAHSIFIGKSRLDIIGGYQYNDRAEQEGGYRISLKMILQTGALKLAWHYIPDVRTEWVAGFSGQIQTNQNRGSRCIVPDAFLASGSAFLFYRKSVSPRLDLETGVRSDWAQVHTFATEYLNTNTIYTLGNIKPFLRNYGTGNGAFGISWSAFPRFFIKTNFSSGFRAPNLAEISSNGLREGTYRYEIGNSGLKMEQNLCGDFVLVFQGKRMFVQGSFFENRFANYIYMASDQTEFLGLQVFRYYQQNAILRGGELMSDITPGWAPGWTWHIQGSIVTGTGPLGPLPFMPPPRVGSSLKYQVRFLGMDASLSFEVDYVARQDRLGPGETPTDQYFLLNGGISLVRNLPERAFSFSIHGSNLANTTYYDHLSRFKYFGIYNMGRNITLTTSYRF